MSNSMADACQYIPSTSTPASPSSTNRSSMDHMPDFPESSTSLRTYMKHYDDSRGCGEPDENLYEYPLAHSSGLIEVIRDDEDHINMEAEEAAYRAFDLDDSDSSALGIASRNARAKPITRPAPTKNRPPSSIFSRDIWVGEDGDAEKDASFARGVRIVGWTSVGDKRGGAYVVYDCAILTHALTTIHVHKRYSAFLSLHNSLMSSLPRSARRHVPPLPPRTALARFRPGFLESRRKALQTWLSTVLLHPEMSGSPSVREWVMSG